MSDYIYVDDNKQPATERKAPASKKIKMENSQSMDKKNLFDKSSIMNFTTKDDEVL